MIDANGEQPAACVCQDHIEERRSRFLEINGGPKGRTVENNTPPLSVDVGKRDHRPSPTPDSSRTSMLHLIVVSTVKTVGSEEPEIGGRSGESE